MQAPEEQGYLMQEVAWFCRSRATERDSTTGTADKSSKKVREYSHRGENGAMRIYSELLEYLM